MSTTYDCIIRGARVITTRSEGVADIGIRAGVIAKVGGLSQADAATTIDARGLIATPGVIDSQVHFREPGDGVAEDLESGSRAAVLGGVGAVFEMPNTRPATTTPEALAEKLRRASGRMHCDYAFYAGATGDNNEALAEMETMLGCCGVKIFMGASTGDLLVPDDAALTRALTGRKRRAAVHCEDEARMQARLDERVAGDVSSHARWRDAWSACRATRRLLRIARERGARVHVLHVTTAAEARLLAHAKDVATMELTPQHLTLAAPGVYARLGSRAQMNPPIRGAGHRAALWVAARDGGAADVIGSDHAPHSLEAKARAYPDSPSGMPGVQTLVSVMLHHVNAGRLSLRRFVELTSAGPRRVFGLLDRGDFHEGTRADILLADMKGVRRVEDADMASRCGWSPFVGMRLRGIPRLTMVRGRVVAREGEIIGSAQGAPMEFHAVH